MSPAPERVYQSLLKVLGPQGWWPVTQKGALAPRYRPGFFGKPTQRQSAEICMGAILTQNTSWGNVEMALRHLHGAGIRDLPALARIPPRRLQELVRSSGYFRQKAKKLKIFARHCIERRQNLKDWLSGPLQALRGELLGLWGIGPETADSILLYAGQRTVFVVDAYTRRIGQRLGWPSPKAYESVQSFYTQRLPRSSRLYAEFHALLVALAKRHCRKNPICLGCPLLDVCGHGQGIVKGAGARRRLAGESRSR